MFKSVALLCVVLCVVVEARPKWQFLPPVPGYVPVYIRPGDTPLEEINPDLAEAFHALPAGRSAGKLVEAGPDVPEEQNDQPQQLTPDQPEAPEEAVVDRRPYEKKVLERKIKKVQPDVLKPVGRR